ncbi:MAG: ATP-binding protein [Acidobacteria bacterium]|nr:ATP-binding protein [Acidobacteriota bacterium]
MINGKNFFEVRPNKQLKILFWDDEAEGNKKTLFTEIKLGFEKYGWIPHIVVDKSIAEKKALEDNYDAVVLDLLEDGKPVGLDLLSNLREKIPFLPIVIFTIATEINYIQQALRGQVSYYLFYPLKDYHDVIHAIGIAIEREKLKEKIINDRYFASIGQLAGGVAHFIKNSLWNIGSRAQILLEKTDKNSENYELLEVIKRRCDDANKVVVDLLNFSQRENLKRKPEKLDILEIINDVLKLMDIDLKHNKIEVERHINTITFSVMGFGFELKEAFLNIIKNALEAMKNGGKLKIEMSSEGQFIQIKIVDNGIGMAADVLENIFIPFYTTKENATGFGLFDTQRIIQKHDGTIEIMSKPNEGTTVTVQIPLMEN